MRKALLVLACCGFAASLWAADAFVGTWKLNPTMTKVTGSGSADRSATAIIESQENGIKLTVDVVDAAGKPIHMEFAAKYDGKDYAVKGYATIETVSIRRINNDTHDRLYKNGGKEVLSERAVTSRDGRTGTVIQKGKDAKGQDFTVVTVWEKQ